MRMTIQKALENEGYTLAYECFDRGDRKQVWVNAKAGMAVRIDWLRLERTIPRA